MKIKMKEKNKGTDFVSIPEGTVTSPKGFSAAGVTCGIKVSGQKDLALIVSDRLAVTAATFTTNKFKAASVLVTQENLKPAAAKVRAIVVNSGNANCATGSQGLKDARRMCEVTAQALNSLPLAPAIHPPSSFDPLHYHPPTSGRAGAEVVTPHSTLITPDEVLVCSTGIIGVRLPMDLIEEGIRQAALSLSLEGGMDAAHAIMTTDTIPKHGAVQVNIGSQMVTIGGIAKGAGMIAPHMATMLCLLTTDAAISRPVLKRALREAVERSFNSITVDGDTSTNDTVILMANGAANNPPITQTESPDFQSFYSALAHLTRHLAQAIARDGEGATKFIEVEVRGAMSEEEAKRIALAVANSNLFKCAMFGNDPNWGRIAAAAGRASARLVADKLSIWIGNFKVMHNGAGSPFDKNSAHTYLKENRDIKVTIDLHLGNASWRVWTCDLSYEYVSENAEYTT